MTARAKKTSARPARKVGLLVPGWARPGLLGTGARRPRPAGEPFIAPAGGLVGSLGLAAIAAGVRGGVKQESRLSRRSRRPIGVDEKGELR